MGDGSMEGEEENLKELGASVVHRTALSFHMYRMM
jgi:hypothetical protein